MLYSYTSWKKVILLGQSLHVHRHASSLAYYALFALGPIFFISLAITQTLTQEPVLESIALSFFKNVLGITESGILDVLIMQTSTGSTNPVILLVSIIIIVFTAMKMFIELRLSTTELIDSSKDVQKQTLFKEWIIPFLITLFIVAGIPIFFVIMSMINITIPFGIINLLGILFLGALCGILYRVIPTRMSSWNHVFLVGYTVSIVISCVTLLLRWYATTLGGESLTGITGSFFLILLWLYVASYIFYMGAIVIRQLEKSRTLW